MNKIRQIRRVATKVHIHDNPEFCQELIESITDEQYQKAETIALIAKDEIIIKVLIEKLLSIGMKIQQIIEKISIFSLQPLSTRLFEKKGFKVIRQLPVDEILPDLLTSINDWDLIIGNPPQQDENESRNNSWTDDIVNGLLAEDTPLRKGGCFAIAFPFKQSLFKQFKKFQVVSITIGVEKYFSGTQARHTYVVKNEKASNEKTLILYDSKEIKLDLNEIEYFANSGNLDCSLVLKNIITATDTIRPKIEASKFHTSNKKTLFARNDDGALLCCTENERPHQDCSTSKYNAEKYVKVWDWSFNNRGHKPARLVSRNKTNPEDLKAAGYGEPKVVWKNKSVSPWTNGMKYDELGEYITTENSIFYPVDNQQDADQIIDYFNTQFFRKIISEEFKNTVHWPFYLCHVPNVSPMTEVNLAEKFALSNELRIKIGLEPIESQDR